MKAYTTCLKFLYVCIHIQYVVYVYIDVSVVENVAYHTLKNDIKGNTNFII